MQSFCNAYGLSYVGPVDGHDVEGLIAVLERAKGSSQPIFIHCRTTKGMGYSPASNGPDAFHSTAPFDISSPQNFRKAPESTSILGNFIVEHAVNDSRIVAVSAAMVGPVGLATFKAQFPDRCFDVGIAEEHATVFAAGLAASGKIPFLVICSTFIQRAYDCVLHDIALQNLPVRICVDRAGLSPGDGPTHHGIYDISFLRSIPNLTLYEPSCLEEMTDMLNAMYGFSSGPIAIRYSRSLKSSLEVYGTEWKSGPIEPRLSGVGNDIALICIGEACILAHRVMTLLMKDGYNCSILAIPTLKPLNGAKIIELTSYFSVLVSLEDSTLTGGFGSSILELFSDNDISKPLIRVGYPDIFLPHGAHKDILAVAAMTEQQVANQILRKLQAAREDGRNGIR
jgi:1-deoxy-D-xylulose-5-phosphate synthase